MILEMAAQRELVHPNEFTIMGDDRVRSFFAACPNELRKTHAAQPRAGRRRRQRRQPDRFRLTEIAVGRGLIRRESRLRKSLSGGPVARCAPAGLAGVGNLRRRTTNCWHRLRFSVSSRTCFVNRHRIASSNWVRKAIIGRFITVCPPARLPDKVFGKHRVIQWATLGQFCTGGNRNRRT